MNIAIIFFSATNNTRIMAEIIRKQFEDKGAKVTLHDVTTPEAREENVDLTVFDAAIFGLPIHSLRAPRLMREWMEALDGNGMPCAMFFTYGGFLVHPAHHSTAEILKRRDFRVVASAEFPGKHTYNLGGWKVFTDRPDKRETALAAQYTEAVLKRFSGEDSGVVSGLDKSKFSDEQLDHFETLRFKMVNKLPTREGAECSLCGQCAEVCPTGAMDYLAGEADPTACIACLGCVDVCPEEALMVNDMTESWQAKLAMDKKTEEELNAQTGKIYL